MDALTHFKDLYGAMDLSENDAARNVFLSGWNSALEEMIERVKKNAIGKGYKGILPSLYTEYDAD